MENSGVTVSSDLLERKKKKQSLIFSKKSHYLDVSSFTTIFVRTKVLDIKSEDILGN